MDVARLPAGLESAPGLAHADFANMYIGGGRLSGGCVQEEIRFAVWPELMLSMVAAVQGTMGERTCSGNMLASIITQAKDLHKFHHRLPAGKLPLLKQHQRHELNISLLANMFLCTFREVSRCMISIPFLCLFLPNAWA